ncbi:hypothetical protein HFK83_03120 [Ralstonia pseudosolanacearum]|uniref:hypothetical protein n=1 Tax=Ralstonia pseudosolanacearum TaxID=1310165 RepID=UPI002004A5F2|nr:hypothetical protein [Ralstonia pseudosolanacearum]MCK4121362.1 hypothetical protein [Ralstonia pseudosolanacearum]
MKTRSLFLAGMAAVVVATGAQAEVHFELGVGVTKYRTGPDGLWYQQGQAPYLDLRSPMVSAGLTGPIYSRGSWGIDWHANYVNLGHSSVQCLCTPRDENYSTASHQKLNAYDVPDANFQGNGNAQGVALTVEPYIVRSGWRFGLEAGPFIHRNAFDEVIGNWKVDPNAAPQTLTVSTSRRLSIGSVVGVSVGRGNFRVSYKHYFMPQRGEYPALWKGADVIELKYVF